MGKVLIIGAGGVGNVVVRKCASVPEVFSEILLASLDCGPANLRARRIDPHPAWSRNGREVVVNLCLGGRRQVAIADLSAMVAPPAALPAETRRSVYA